MARLQTAEETGRKVMALTRDFKETVRGRVQRDPAFRRKLLREGVESFLAGDVETGKSLPRDYYINATIGFTELARITHHSSKSLMRMPGPSEILTPKTCSRLFLVFRRKRVFTSSLRHLRQEWGTLG
jgi:hypothetical protein